jgi:DNA-directed RNA polymerase specialized sigma24 family protein
VVKYYSEMPHNEDKPQSGVWPPLANGYLDEFGSIDPAVHEAAGRLWPAVEVHLRRAQIVSEDGQLLMLKAVALVTRARCRRTEEISNIDGYLWRTFHHLLLEELEKRALHSKLDAEFAARLAPASQRSEDEITKIILMREILERADDWLRQVIELLQLGHTYEEIAVLIGGRANAIRSRVSKQLKILARQIGKERE